VGVGGTYPKGLRGSCGPRRVKEEQSTRIREMSTEEDRRGVGSGQDHPKQDRARAVVKLLKIGVHHRCGGGENVSISPRDPRDLDSELRELGDGWGNLLLELHRDAVPSERSTRSQKRDERRGASQRACSSLRHQRDRFIIPLPSLLEWSRPFP
jgi:hypothetical protein